MANEGYHEPIEELTYETRDMHRAITSLMEELEAVDWYDQRIDAADDAELRRILAHNRDEEKEHAAMVIEWLRRNDEGFEHYLKTYLFTDSPIVSIEVAETRSESAVSTDDQSLRIGGLREGKA